MRELLQKLETEMRHKFEVVRSKFEHSGNKGTKTEVILREFLRAYLPKRCGVGHGEIVDSHDGRSSQTDIVIVTDEHPFTFADDQPGLFFIEGVFAVGEVKSVLTSQEFEKTIANAVKLRELKCSPQGMTILLRSTNESDSKRFVGNPPCFLFAFTTQLSKKTVLQRLSAQTRRSIDAVFFLDGGAILDLGDGKGFLKFQRADGVTQVPVTGWCEFEGFNALALLLLWLSGMPDAQYTGGILSKYLLAALDPPAAARNPVS